MADLPRLNRTSIALRRQGVVAPSYDRDAVRPGIVHFGPGAFQRAHIASYVEALLPRDPRWGMAGIALRHGALARALAQQDFLYTLVELEEPARYRVLGALTDYIVAPADPARAFRLLDDPDVRLVTITVTEKGYGLDAAGELDPAHPDIARDLAGGGPPASLIGWLVAALARRRARGLAPLTVMSCDNVASNGVKLRRAVADFARASGDAALAGWIEAEAKFPSTMVDSITPAGDDALLARVADAVGLSDLAPVQREGFTQWVIEDDLGPGMPDLASVGAELTNDIHAFEQAKLRLLNGTHSALAYLGLLRGRATVGEAMTDAPLAAFVERMMRRDVAATLKPARGMDVQSYIGALLKRLRNPAIAHRLAQIAADGSLKLPYRFLEPIGDLLASGRPIGRLCVPVAAWMGFVRRAVARGEPLDDPLAGALTQVARNCTGRGETDVPLFLAVTQIFPRDLAAHADFEAAVEAAYDDPDAVLR